MLHNKAIRLMSYDPGQFVREYAKSRQLPPFDQSMINTLIDLPAIQPNPETPMPETAIPEQQPKVAQPSTKIHFELKFVEWRHVGNALHIWIYFILGARLHLQLPAKGDGWTL